MNDQIIVIKDVLLSMNGGPYILAAVILGASWLSYIFACRIILVFLKKFFKQTATHLDDILNEAQIGQIAGFSLHAGIMARRDQSAGITNDLDHARQLTKHGASFEDARFYVFRRQGLQCYRCGNLIEKISHTGQACFCCPRCQQT